MTEIYLIRHAESFGNLTRRAYGWFDGIITPKGYAQIEMLRERFRDINIDTVYSSDLIRACETAKAIYEPKNLPLNKEPAFRELRLGVWEDRPWGELLPKYEKEYEAWQNNPLEFYVDGSETYRDVYERAKGALDRIVAENENRAVAIVSHGAAIRIMLHGLRNAGNLCGVEKAEWGDNTCVSHLKFSNGEFHEVFSNCNEHLRNLYGFEDGLSWVREGGGNNANFKPAILPEDEEKIRSYRRLGEKEVFGSNICDEKVLSRHIRALIRNDRENIAFGFIENEEIGMIELDGAAKVYPSAGHVSFIYLKPEYRRKRYGIQLVGYAMSKYKELGKKHISIRVSEKNDAAYAFYKKYGFYEVFRENDGGTIQRVMLLDI